MDGDGLPGFGRRAGAGGEFLDLQFGIGHARLSSSASGRSMAEFRQPG
jgi:hypothetical protein